MKPTAIISIAALLLASMPCHAAFGTNATWQIQTTATAANANGGGFDFGNANFATDLACTSATGNAPVCTSASFNFVSAQNGAQLFIQSGGTYLNSYGGTTATTGNGCWYLISSVAANALTVDATLGHAVCTDRNSGNPSPRFRASTVAGVATTASPTSGVWGIDYSQLDVAPFANTDLASVTGTTNPCTVTSAGTPVDKTWVGNGIHISAGTNWTKAWNEVVSVSVVTATLDAACGSSAAITAGTFKVGGAISLGSATASQTDGNFLFGAWIVGGNRIFVKTATYTMGASSTIAAGTASNPVAMEGYQTTRGDRPSIANAPTLAFTTLAMTLGANVSLYNLSITGTPATLLTAAANSLLSNVKIVNSSTTANRLGVIVAASGVVFENVEIVSYRGRAISKGAGGFFAHGCYLHDSDIAILDTAAAAFTVQNCIISGNVTAGYSNSAAETSAAVFNNVTFFGATNKLGVGLNIATTGSSVIRLVNSIVSGFTTGATHVDVQSAGYDDYNDYFNNTTDISNWQKGPSDLALDPAFVNVGQYTGTTATSSTNVLTDSGANFANVTDNVDFCYVSAITGTGGDTGQHLITSHTSTTLTLSSNLTSSGAGTAITYSVTTGHNFAIGNTSVKSGSFPGLFPGGLTTGYLGMGAVNPQGSSGSQVGYAGAQ